MSDIAKTNNSLHIAEIANKLQSCAQVEFRPKDGITEFSQFVFLMSNKKTIMALLANAIDWMFINNNPIDHEHYKMLYLHRGDLNDNFSVSIAGETLNEEELYEIFKNCTDPAKEVVVYVNQQNSMPLLEAYYRETVKIGNMTFSDENC